VQGGVCVRNKQLISIVSGFPTEFCTGGVEKYSGRRGKGGAMLPGLS
jgi:hypothetical protein